MCEHEKSECISIDLTLSPMIQSDVVEMKRKRLRQTTLSGRYVDIEDDAAFYARKRAAAIDESFSSSLTTAALPLKASNRKDSSLLTTTVPLKTVKSANNSTSLTNSFVRASLNTALWERALQVLVSTFGITSLRSLQPQAVQGALMGKSQIVVMATGSGKSLCYQLPATVLTGLTIVISPLIALMVDQVQSLNAKGIEAEYISSLDNTKTRNDVLHRITGTVPPKKRNQEISEEEREDQRPEIKLLYCTPELIATPRFQTILQTIYSKGRLSLIAIDEAHCISSWGHDFRPSYRKLSWLRSTFIDLPIMACTATATSRVIEDIREVLSISKSDACLVSSFNRPNISYEVRNKDSMGENSALKDLVCVIKSEHNKARLEVYPCSGIVYVHKRNDTTFIAKAISDAGVLAAPYHAGLKDDQRQQVQEQWTKGTVKVAVATVAFGMGIDLPHVRYVIHWSLSKSIEGFYQESGRGGRDLRPAKSILYYSQYDASSLIFLCRQAADKKINQPNAHTEDKQLQSIQAVVEYCTTPECRRKYLLNFFGEKINPKSVCNLTCDNCINPQGIDSKSLGLIKRGFSNQNHQYVSRDVFKNDDDWNGQWDRPHNDSASEDDETTARKIEEKQDESSFMSGAWMSTWTGKGPTKTPKEILKHYEVSNYENVEHIM